MRISELSHRTGVSVATIKYYLREGLLPPGTPTAVNQADYGDQHAHRLRLIRVLRDVGELGIADIRSILESLDDERLTVHQLLQAPHRALARAHIGSGGARTAEGATPGARSASPAGGGPATDARFGADDLARARQDVDRFLEDLGWDVGAEAPDRTTLAEVLVALRRLGHEAGPEVFGPYAAVADQVAQWEVASLPGDQDRLDTLEQTVVGTVVFEAALTALRRLAQEHHSSRRFGA